MPVQPESLEILEKTDVSPAQPRAIGHAIEIEVADPRHETGRPPSCDTRRRRCAPSIRHEMQELGIKLRQEMKNLRHGLELGIASMETKLGSTVTHRPFYACSAPTRMPVGHVPRQLLLELGLLFFAK